MSADNYVIVRRFSDGWRWAMGFASDDIPLPDSAFRNGPFGSEFDAQDDAEAKCLVIEYGIKIERPSKQTDAVPVDHSVMQCPECVKPMKECDGWPMD